jgi:ribonuclease VapC
MVLDSSAIIAILTREPEAPGLARAIEADPVIKVSAATALEVSMVLTRWYGVDAADALDLFLRGAGASVEAFDERQWRIAQNAYVRYGKGRGHPAQLNICDCMSYALARVTGESLLFKGEDFAQTDIRVADWS